MARLRSRSKRYDHWSRRLAPISATATPERRLRPRRGRRGGCLRRAIIAAAVIAFLILAAQPFRTEPADRIPFLAEQDVTVVAHAGGIGHAPANTFAAFDTAIEMGSHVLEMDLQLTADNEVVVIHDGTVDRTTDGSGRVRDMSLEDVRELDAGYNWRDTDGDLAYRGEGLRIPTLEEVFDRYQDIPLVIEMKTDSGDEIIAEVARVVQDAGRFELLIVASFDAEYLDRFRAKVPDVPTNLAVREAATFYALQLVGLHRWYRPPGEVLQVPTSFSGLPVLVPGFIRKARNLGLDVQVWTINDYDEMVRLLEAGVDGLITDYPDRAIAAARAVGRSVSR